MFCEYRDFFECLLVTQCILKLKLFNFNDFYYAERRKFIIQNQVLNTFNILRVITFRRSGNFVNLMEKLSRGPSKILRKYTKKKLNTPFHSCAEAQHQAKF
jgi:hypothetical protein